MIVDLMCGSENGQICDEEEIVKQFCIRRFRAVTEIRTTLLGMVIALDSRVVLRDMLMLLHTGGVSI